MASVADTQPQSLGDAINATTRKAHATLNKLIIARLPEALPPRAVDPSPYISGILHVAPVYIQFEGLWQKILNTSPPLAPTGSIPDACDPTLPKLDDGSILTYLKEEIKVHRPMTCERLHSMLEHLQLPGLMRSGQLRADLRSLTRWPNVDVEDELEKIRQMGPLADFLDHMKRSIEDKPHVLVAYAYIFYMALFAGGRFIRASLEYAGPEFWSKQPSPVKPTMRPCEPITPVEEKRTDQLEGDAESGLGGSHGSHKAYDYPLRFFHFATPSDGEDLKTEFKKRLADAEGILTTRERADIIQESVAIFDHMTLVVGQLHVLCAGSTEAAAKSSSNLLGLSRSLLMARLRDSVAVAKDRRSARRSPDDGTASSEGGYGSTQEDGQSHGKSSSEGDSHSLSGHASGNVTPKSMRFEGALPQPDRKGMSSMDGAADIPELAVQSPVKKASMTAIRLILATALGVVIFAAQFYWRRRGVDL